VRIAFYDGGAKDVSPRVEDFEWSQLVQVLTTHRRSEGCLAVPCTKETVGKCAVKLACPAWSPVDIEGKRADENVRSVTALVVDLDHLTDADSAPFEALEKSGYAHVLYSTHSHHPPNDICLRAVIPLSRPVPRAEWRKFWAAALIELGLPGDRTCVNESRIYFLPDAPMGGAEPIAMSAEGRALDVDALLGRPVPSSAGEPPRAQLWRGEAEGWETPSASAPVDLGGLATLLKKHARAENRALVGRVLRGEPLAKVGEQDDTLQALMSTVAFCLPNDTPDDAVVHMLRPSFAATDWKEGTEHLIQEALKKLHRARQRKKERDAAALEKNKRVRASLGMPETFAEVPADEGAPDPFAWMGELITKSGQKLADHEGGVVSLKNCAANIELVLRCDERWRGVLRFNEVTKKTDVVGGPLGAGARSATLDSEVAIWVQRSEYGALGLMPDGKNVREIITQVAYSNSYDPLREHLESLKWDGVSRIDTFLERYYGAKGDERFTRTVSRKWFISAVARALNPGCKVDTVLIVKGLQGAGKSTSFRALGSQWFTDSRIDMSSTDADLKAGAFWIIELGELKDVKRSNLETVKDFLSRQEGSYRVLFKQVMETAPRRCVFVGSTNDLSFLKFDPSGYRRFWTVECQKVEVDAVRRDAPQLWAEAVHAYRAGIAAQTPCLWWLTPEEGELAETVAREFAEVVGEVNQDLIADWFRRTPNDQRPRKLTLRQVMTDVKALNLQAHQITPAKEREIVETLRAMGFERCIIDARDGRRRGWKTPDYLLTDVIPIAADAAA
jgi:predicted P-loop ATPase